MLRDGDRRADRGRTAAVRRAAVVGRCRGECTTGDVQRTGTDLNCGVIAADLTAGDRQRAVLRVIDTEAVVCAGALDHATVDGYLSAVTAAVTRDAIVVTLERAAVNRQFGSFCAGLTCLGQRDCSVCFFARADLAAHVGAGILNRQIRAAQYHDHTARKNFRAGVADTMIVEIQRDGAAYLKLLCHRYVLKQRYRAAARIRICQSRGDAVEGNRFSFANRNGRYRLGEAVKAASLVELPVVAVGNYSGFNNFALDCYIVECIMLRVGYRNLLRCAGDIHRNGLAFIRLDRGVDGLIRGVLRDGDRRADRGRTAAVRVAAVFTRR